MPRKSQGLKERIEEHPIWVASAIAVAAFLVGSSVTVGLYEKFRMPFYENKLESAFARESELGAKAERLERELSVARRELEQARTLERTASTRAEGLGRDLLAQRTASTNSISANGNSSGAGTPESPLSPISIELLPGITPTNAEASRVALRLKRQLRELTFLESGKRMSNAPSGTYLFSYALRLDSEAVTDRTFQVNSRVSGQGNSRHFEFHRTLEGKDFLIGFASETDAANVSNLNGRDRVRIVLFPDPHHAPMTMLSIPVDRIVRVNERPLLEGTSEMVRVVDLEVR